MKYGDALEELIREIVRDELAQLGRAVETPKPPAQEAYSEAEFCRRVGISRETARRVRRAGKLKFTQIGRRVLYTPEHVAEFLKANEKLRRRVGHK